MSRRDQISLSEDERREYLEKSKTIMLSTIDRQGYPHTVPMWFVVDDDGAVRMTTYAKSQKVLNIRRNPKVALLAESGITYESLKGVLMRGVATVVADHEQCLQTLGRIYAKMSGATESSISEAMRGQASKRVVILFLPQKISSWDHRKLGGVY